MNPYFPERIFFPGDDSPNDRQRQPWVDCKNDSGEQVPAFACVKLSTLSIVGTGDVPLIISKPDTFGAQYSHGFAHPCPIGAGNRGQCVQGYPYMVGLYDEGDGTPAANELWGPRNGTWKLKKNTGGFQVIGVTNSIRHLVLVRPAPMLTFHGQAQAAISMGNSGDINVFAGATDTTVAISVQATYGDIDDDAMVWSQYDLLAGIWRGIQTPCP